LRAARVAGARPFQAWRHAVLQPLAWPLLAAFVAAFLVGLAKGPLSSPLLHKLAIFRTWDVSAGLLLAIVSLSALGALPRRRPA
jgi:ABC-type maltose transport system permease subunit